MTLGGANFQSLSIKLLTEHYHSSHIIALPLYKIEQYKNSPFKINLQQGHIRVVKITIAELFSALVLEILPVTYTAQYLLYVYTNTKSLEKPESVHGLYQFTTLGC